MIIRLRDALNEACNSGMYDEEEIESCLDIIRADERARIAKELKTRIAEETLGRNVSDVGIGLEIALKIVRGGE